MEALQTIINAIVIGAVGLILARMVHGSRSELKEDIVQLRAEVRADISGLKEENLQLRTEVRADISELREDIVQLRAEVRADISEVRRDVGELRSDLTQVALAVGARPRAGEG